MNSFPDAPDDAALRAILTSAHTIAVVGASANVARPVFWVMQYLIANGYRVIPINPGYAGNKILGQMVYARLADVPHPIDIVDIFRRQSALAGIVDEALALNPVPKTIWMQLGLRDDTAAAKARSAGLLAIMNRCIRIEHRRLI